MELNKEYIRNSKHIVLLICDFYETNQIPKKVYAIKDNLALFPVVNVPLIELILTNLANQDLKNVVLVGSRIDALLLHLEGTCFRQALNMRVFRTASSSLGDVFREMHSRGFEFKDLLVTYANHFTNIPLSQLMKYHKEARDNLMTMYAYPHDTNDTNVYMYALVGRDILYYDKLENGRIEAPEIVAAVYKEKSVDIAYWHGSPTIVALSKEALSIFHENFDFHTLGDLLSGMLASKIYGFKFQMLTDDDFEDESYEQASCSESSAEEEWLGRTRRSQFYSREVNTLLDYFRLNKDLGENPSIISHRRRSEFIKSAVRNGHMVQNSIVGTDSRIEGNLYDCIVWNNCSVGRDCNRLIVISDDFEIDVFHLESEGIPEEKVCEDIVIRKESETFFEDVSNFLRSRVATAKLYDIDMQDVYKQISLLRIIWNATKYEVIEAFAYFMIDIIDSLNLEESLSRATVIFCILSGSITNREEQEHLMDALYDSSFSLEDTIRAQVFFNYGYLFVQEGIVSKSVVRKYNRMYESGKF